MRISFLAASAAALALQQVSAQSSSSSSSSSSSTPTSSGSASSTQQGEITIHTVTVGKIENEFDPQSITAVPGDIVSFEFFPGNHSVARAEYGFPCVPYEDITGKPGFTSGFMPVNSTFSGNPTWNITINDTAPVFYYCGAPGSCIGWGMLGVINPTKNTPLDTQIELAKQANYMIEPGEPFPASAFQSLSSLAATATTTTLTVTATNSWEPTSTSTGGSATGTAGAASSTPSSSSQSNSLSAGAIAGIAVGAAIVVGALAGGLFFLLGRQKSMKDELGRLRNTDQPGGPNGGPAHGTPHMTEAMPTPNLHHSQLPPYQYSPWQQEHKPTGSFVGSEGWDAHTRVSAVPTEMDRYSHASEPPNFAALRGQTHSPPAPMSPQEMFAPHAHGSVMHGELEDNSTK